MKNLLAIEKTKNGKMNAERFIVRKLPEHMDSEVEGFNKRAGIFEKKSQSPLWLRIFEDVAIGFGSLICLIVLIPSEGVTITEAYQNAPYLFYIGPILLFIGLGFWVFDRLKYKKAVKSPEANALASEQSSLIARIDLELNVPSDAKRMDFFFFGYKTKKDGTQKISSYGFFDALNGELSVFKENDSLCLADHRQVLAVPLSSFTKIVEVDKRIVFAGWNKETPYDAESYKAFKIKRTQYGSFWMKGYCSIRFVHENEDYEIVIPKYELEALNELLGLPVEAKK